MNRDGGNARRVTKLGKASFAPFFSPDGKKIIFASNYLDPRGRNFDLFLVNVDGTELEQVTFNDSFDGFPMFSLMERSWCSLPTGLPPRKAMNVFIADWRW